MAIKKSPILESLNNFVTFRKITNKNRSGSTSYFKTASISVWAKIKTPKSVRFGFNGSDLQSDKQVYSRTYSIVKSSGYRVSGTKSIAQSGEYEIRLFNENNQLLSKIQFKVKLG